MRKLWIAVGLLAAAMLATGLAARALAEPVALGSPVFVVS